MRQWEMVGIFINMIWMKKYNVYKIKWKFIQNISINKYVFCLDNRWKYEKNKNKNRHYINIKFVFYNNVFEHIQTKPEIHNKRYGYVV